MSDYKFHLSPEWEIVIPEVALKKFNCHPYGPLLDSAQTRMLLLKAALWSEENTPATFLRNHVEAA